MNQSQSLYKLFFDISSAVFTSDKSQISHLIVVIPVLPPTSRNASSEHTISKALPNQIMIKVTANMRIFITMIIRTNCIT